VVVVNGARQVGKSTLAELVLRQDPGGIARFLDDPVTRAAATEDPLRFIRHDGLMLIDEVQRVPDLWLAIKHVVDRDPRPGRFLLTGSAWLLALHSIPDALPGRAETIELWPLSQGEIDGMPDGFVDAVFNPAFTADSVLNTDLTPATDPEGLFRPRRPRRLPGASRGACAG
jgi:predicted AAA+ superfamily ATPase